jgi:hypothetical protein
MPSCVEERIQEYEIKLSNTKIPVGELLILKYALERVLKERGYQ